MDVLWLASWYPDKTSPFNGDFIQRHAVAVSSRCRVTLIHVAKDVEGKAAFETETIVSAGGALTERIIYFRPPSTPFPVLNRLLSQVRSSSLYARAIKQYIAERGHPPFIHVHVCMNAGILALWAKYRWKIPYLVTEHFTAYIPGSEGNYFSRPFLYRRINRLILKEAAGVHTVSRFLLECVERITPVRNPVIIPNVVNTSLFHPLGASKAEGAINPALETDQAISPASETTRQARPFRFIHVSSFQAFKNVQGMLDAFALLSQRRTDWELMLAGPADEWIRLYADTLGLSVRIRWTGELPYAGIAALMREAEALVLFSRYETQGCVLLEALCTGLPVVSSNVGGVPEIINAADGLLTPSGDIPALAGTLDRIMMEYMARDRPRIAANAAEKYGYGTVAHCFMEYYTSVFQGAVPGGVRPGGAATGTPVPGSPGTTR